MNAVGPVVSLAFGGDRTSREGCAIPMVLRYLLETCENVAQAERLLVRMPEAMAYNLTVVDRTGTARTAYLRPGHYAEFGPNRWTPTTGLRPVGPVHAPVRHTSVRRLLRPDAGRVGLPPAHLVRGHVAIVEVAALRRP